MVSDSQPPSDSSTVHSTSDGWADPMPLPSALPEVMPYHSDLLPAVGGDRVDDIACRMQTPPDFPAAAM